MKCKYVVSLVFLITSFSFAQVNRFPVLIKGKWGYINSDSRVIIPAKYDGADYFDSSGMARVKIGNHVTLIDTNDKYIIEPIYDNIRKINNIIIGGFKNGKWELVSLENNLVLEKEHEDYRQENGFIYYKKNGKYGILNRQGQNILPSVFDSVYLYSYNYFIVIDSSYKGVYDTLGKSILACEYDKIEIQSSDRILFSKNHKWGIADNDKIICQPDWDGIQWLNSNLFKLTRDSLHTVFDVKAGNIICNPVDLSFNTFSEDYLLTGRNGLAGLISRTGKEIIKPAYDRIVSGTKNSFIVKKNGKCGLVDKSGKVLIQAKYDGIFSFDERIAMTIDNNLYGLINDKGDVLADPFYQSIVINQGIVKAQKNGSLVIIEVDENGNPLDSTEYINAKTIHVGSRTKRDRIKIDYSKSVFQNGGWFYSPIHEKYGLKNTDGVVVIQPVYDQIYVNNKTGLTKTEIQNVQSIYKIGKAVFYLYSKYGLVDHINYNIISSPNFLSINADDFEKTIYARCISESGQQGIISRTGYRGFLPKTFVSAPDGNTFYYCSRGKIVLEKKGESDEQLISVNDFLKTLDNRWKSVDEETENMIKSGDQMLRCKDSFWAIYSRGKITTPPRYQFIKYCTDGLAVIKENDKWGICDYYGREISEIIYDKIDEASMENYNFFRVSMKNEKYGIVDAGGKVIVDPVYENAGKCHEERIAVKLIGRWGFIDNSGNVIGQIKYDQVRDFENGYAAVKMGKLWGFINKEGEEIIPMKYTGVGNFSEELAPVKIKSKWGFINNKGELVIPAVFNKARPFQNEHAWVATRSKFGLLDKSNNWLIKEKYNSAEDFNYKGISRVSKGKYYFLLDASGEVMSKKFEAIKPFSENGIALVQQDGKWGYIDSTGKIIIRPEFLKGYNFSEGYAVVLSDSGHGLIDETGKFTMLKSLRKITFYNDGLAGVLTRKGKYGVIDMNQDINIISNNRIIGNFSNGIGILMEDTVFYYIDQWGNDIFKRHFQLAKEFNDNLAIVKQNNHWGVINEKGINVISPKYDYLDNFSEGLATFRLDLFSGIIDYSGKVVIEPAYDYVEYSGNNLFRVERNNKVGYQDKSGKIIWGLQN